MKVCIMMDSWNSDLIGGGYVLVWQVATRLVANYNCRVDLVVGPEPVPLGRSVPNVEYYFDDHLRVIRVGSSKLMGESLFSKLVYCIASISQVLKGNYDLINAQAFAPGLPGWILSKVSSIPVVYSVHGVGFNSMELMVKNPLKAKLLKSCEKLLLFKLKYNHQISVSRDIFDYPNVNQKITVISSGVDVTEFDVVTCKKASKFQIVFVGRFHPQKGLFDLVEAIRQVVAVHPEVRVLMVGNGPQRQTIQHRVREYRLEAHFDFTGNLTGVNKIRAFKSSHLFVLPSLYEGQPSVLLEAWAAKLPVIVTTVGANPDFVVDGENGYLVPPQQPEQLARAIIKAVENPQLQTLGQEGYNLVQTKYSWDTVAEQTYQVYKKTIKAKNQIS